MVKILILHETIDLLIFFSEGLVPVTFEQLIQFVTGVDSIPPAGFSPGPSISFAHRTDYAGTYRNTDRFLTRANTCANQVVIAVDERTRRYQKFKDNMVWAMAGCGGFAPENLISNN